MTLKYVTVLGHVTSNLLNSPYDNAFGQQTCQVGDILLGAPTHKSYDPYMNVALVSQN